MSCIRGSLSSFIASTTYTIVLPEPMPTNFAVGSKCSFTACWAALRFAASMSEVAVVDIAGKVEE